MGQLVTQMIATYPTLGGGAGVLIVVRDMDDMVDMEERPPGEVRPPIREEGELHRPPSTWREMMVRSKRIGLATNLIGLKQPNKILSNLSIFHNFHLCQDGILLLDDFLQHGHATVGHLVEVVQSKETQELVRQEC